MAMLPFPTFGGPQQGGGIMNVKLPASQMRFPVARRPAPRRAVEPDLDEKIAPLLPFALSGLKSLFKDSPELMNDASFLESINADPNKPSQLDTAKLEAYKIYGPDQPQDTFGGDDILDLIIAASLGRGGDDYAKSAASLKTAQEKSRLTTQTNKQSLINKLLTDTGQKLLMTDVNALQKGQPTDSRSANYVNGTYYVQNDNKDGYVDINDPSQQGRQWIIAPTNMTLRELGGSPDPRLEKMFAQNNEFAQRNTALINFAVSGEDLMELLSESRADKSLSPLTAVAGGLNILNNIGANFEQFKDLTQEVRKRSGLTDNFFSDGGDPSTSGKNLTLGTQGNGTASKQLYEKLSVAIENDDPAEMQKILTEWENTADLGQDFLKKIGLENGFGFGQKDLLKDVAFQKARVTALLLQSAYAAAAANGQTGRTLSDKDLAYHLKMVGFGATQDIDTLHDVFLSFFDTTINQTDASIKSGMSMNRIRSGFYDTSDPMQQPFLREYYSIKQDPALITPTNPQGFDWTNYDEYKFKDIYTRNSDQPDLISLQKRIKEMQKGKVPTSTVAPTNTNMDERYKLKTIQFNT